MASLPRAGAVLAGTAVLLVLAASPAWAHATFPNTSTVPVGKDVTLKMDVPNEHDDSDYNSRVDIVIPDGWTRVACKPKATWTCSTTSVGAQSYSWTKTAGAPPAEDEAFEFTVHVADKAGTYAFKTVQTYNSGGEPVRWIQGPGGEYPAPTLKAEGTVTAPAPAATKPAATHGPTTAPHTAMPMGHDTATAAPTATASSTPSVGATAPSASATPVPAKAVEVVEVAEAAGGVATTAPTTAPSEPAVQLAADKDVDAGSSSALGWIAGGAGLLALTGGAVAVRRRRTA